MPPQFKQKKVWVPAVLALLVGLYALAGFLWAPVLLRGALLDGIQKKTGLTARVGEIRLNPFLMQLEVKDFVLPEIAGAKLIGFDRLFVDFEMSSLWRRAFVFKDIEIAGPYAHAVVSPDGRLNFAALTPASAAPPPPPATKHDEPLPAIQIASFSVARGVASYEDNSRANPIAARLDPIGFELKDFTTGVEGGRFKFTGVSKLGERLQWQGHFSLQPLESDGSFQVVGLRAHTIWEYIKQQVGFYVNSGSIDLNGEYRFTLRERPELHLALAKLSLRGMGIRPDESTEDWISVPSLIVSGTALDLAQHTVHVDSIAIDDLKVQTWLERDHTVNLLRLARAPPAVPSDAVTTSPPVAAAPWQVELAQFELSRARIGLQDRGTTPAAQFEIAPLNLKVTGGSLDLSKPLSVALDTGINADGRLALSGSVTPSPFVADLKIDLGTVPLKSIQPYLAQRTAMTLEDGRLNADGQAHLALPSIKFAGNVSIDHLHTIDNETRKDFVSWNRLLLQKIDFQHAPDRLSIDTVTANKLYARVAIAPDRSVNVAKVLAGPAPPSESKAAAAPERGSRATPPVRQAAATAVSPAPAVGAAPTPMPISIRKVLLQSSNANFSDLSVQPNFSAGIQTLEGSITGLSSRQNSRAKVDLRGQVDRFSPVEIRGEINVFSTSLYTDLSMNFRNMELTTFNPYSGKFAGYNIAKGKLTTELSYKIDGRKLNAGHHVIIDQLEFGAKTASKDAVSLPVKLAVALLKDRHGVIDLDVPVTGSLDDPQFRLGPIIWKVLVNILVKIVTSPFALLGSMFGGGPDLQFVDFPAGIATLDAAGQTKVKNIAKALIERPQLKISIPLAAVAELDRAAMVEAQMRELIAAQQRLQLPHKKTSAEQAVPAFESLPPAAQVDLLGAVYKRVVGAAPQFPTEPKAASRAEAKAQAAAANLDFLLQALRKSLTIGDGDIKALAQRRAEAIQLVLLTDTQLDPARVFLVANDKAKAQEHDVRLELTLE